MHALYYLQEGLVLLNPLQWLLEMGIYASYWWICRVCISLRCVSIFLLFGV